MGVINSSCSNIGTGSNSSGLVGPCAGTTVITDCYTADCNVMAKSTDGETGDAVGGIVSSGNATVMYCHFDFAYNILVQRQTGNNRATIISTDNTTDIGFTFDSRSRSDTSCCRKEKRWRCF